jgi:hypothetical protein
MEIIVIIIHHHSSSSSFIITIIIIIITIQTCGTPCGYFLNGSTPKWFAMEILLNLMIFGVRLF